MIVCPFCNTENEAFLCFCIGCGADLEDLAKPAAEPAPPPPVTPEPAKPVRVQVEELEPTSISMPVFPPEPPKRSTLIHAEPPAIPEPPATGRVSSLEPRERALRERVATPTPTLNKIVPPRMRGRLVLIMDDGMDGAHLPLYAHSTILGREGADIEFAHDELLAKRHAEFYYVGDTLYLRPFESTNGVFLQLHQEARLHSGDVFRIGQQVLCFEVLADLKSVSALDPRGQAIPLGSPIPKEAWGRLAQIIAPETFGSVYLLGGPEISLGRERGDITFPVDGFVSGSHAQISRRSTGYFLRDLGSSNGTYLRLTEPAPVPNRSFVFIGQHLLRVEY